MRFDRMKFRKSALAGILAAAFPFAAQAFEPGSDPYDFSDIRTESRQMIEVGAGGMFDGSGMNFLLRVRFRSEEPTAPADPQDVVQTSEQLVWMEVSAEAGLLNGPDSEPLPYVDVRFVPLQKEITIEDIPNDMLVRGGLQLLPAEFTRFLALDRSAGLEISLIGGSAAIEMGTDEILTFFVQLAVDAIGYKFQSHFSGNPAFHGFQLLDLGLSAGLEAAFSTNFVARVEIGLSGDLNFGGSGEFGVQSDVGAFLQVSAEVYRYLEIFARAAVRADLDGSTGSSVAAPYVIFGVSARF